MMFEATSPARTARGLTAVCALLAGSALRCGGPLDGPPAEAPAIPVEQSALPGYSTQGYSTQGYSTQGYSTQGYSTQGYSTQGYSTQGYSVGGASTVSLGDVTGFDLSALVAPTAANPLASTVDFATLSQGHIMVGKSRARPVTSGASPTAQCPGFGAVGLSRDCGWQPSGIGFCTPGTAVQLGSGPNGTCGPCTGDSMVRVCSGLEPCTWAARVADNDDCGGTLCSATRFTCPSSGVFSVLTAPYYSASPASIALATFVAPSGSTTSRPAVVYPAYDWVSGTSLDACPSFVSGDDRSCGFQVLGYGNCTPGTSMTLSGSSCDDGYALRVCSGTMPCDRSSSTFLGAGFGSAYDFGAWGGGPSWVVTTCPAVAFTCPASGTYVALGGGYNSNVTISAAFRLTASGPFPLVSPPATVGLPVEQPLVPPVVSGQSPVGAPIDGVTESGLRVPMLITRVLPEVASAQGYDAATSSLARYAGATRRYAVSYASSSATCAGCLPATDPRTNRTSTFAPLCRDDAHPDADAPYSIPIPGTWRRNGDTSTAGNLVSLPCRTGVVAKCYRWGYRAWDAPTPAEREDLRRTHQMCTRMARADYCGTGESWTLQDTQIDLWDQANELSSASPYDLWYDRSACSPGAEYPHCRQRPAETYAADGTGSGVMHFEAGWNERGAVCLSRERWDRINAVSRTLNPSAPTALHAYLECPTRLYNPAYLQQLQEAAAAGALPPGVHLCTVSFGGFEVQGFYTDAEVTFARYHPCHVPNVCESASSVCACDEGGVRVTYPASAEECQERIHNGSSCQFSLGGLDFGPDARIFNGSQGGAICADGSPCPSPIVTSP